MAFTNFDTKEINCKILFAGPDQSGKTANLRSLCANTSPEIKTGILELSEDERGPTRFFDFLPISVGYLKDFHVKLHLYTLQKNPLYESVNSVILKGVDGLIFVADSQMERLPDNIAALSRTRELLSSHGINPADLPTVFQFNKRDLGGILPVSVLRQELNPAGQPDIEATATKDIGTLDTLQHMAKAVMRRLALQGI